MTGFYDKDGTLYADSIPLVEIADNVGTPTYVYSTAEIKKQYDALYNTVRTAVPDTQNLMLCYACKANGNLGVLSYLSSLGCDLEVVSGGELKRGLKAGFKPSQIVFTGVGKTEEEIELGITEGIHLFNIESLPELEKINAIASRLNKNVEAVFRLNPNIANAAVTAKTSTGGKYDKFGISEDQVFEGYALAENMPNIDILGVSVHIGSQLSKVETFEEAFAKMPDLVQRLRDKGYTVSRLDIGGGFPIVYKDEDLLDLDAYARWIKEYIAPLGTEIILEPGRYLVGNAGVLLTHVTYIKETAEKDFLVVDAGMNDLIRPAMYDAYHAIEAAENRNAPQKTYDVAGPICESSDMFAKNRQIPEMAAGDIAVIRSAGAYGFCMASNYNARCLPAEVIVHDNSFIIVRPRQTFEDIIESETIPDWNEKPLKHAGSSGF